MSTGSDLDDFPTLPTAFCEDQDQARLLELNQVFLKACEADPAKRANLRQRAAAILNEDEPVVWLWKANNIYGVDTNKLAVSNMAFAHSRW